MPAKKRVAVKKKVKETGCCKPFNPAPWDCKTVIFKNKLFLKTHVVSFMHIPLNMNSVMLKAVKAIEAAKAWSKEALMLSDENSLWGSDLYIHVSKEVSGYEKVLISGTFLTKVYEGAYSQMNSWVNDLKSYVASKGKTIKKFYCFYTTCPACAKAYGKNYVVLLAQI
jgi:hypothetical protein